MSRILLKKLRVPHLFKKFPAFDGILSSLPYSLQPATSPFPEPDTSNPRSPSLLLKIHFNFLTPPCACLPSNLFPVVFKTRTYTHLPNSRKCNRPHPSRTLHLVTPTIAVLVNFTEKCMTNKLSASAYKNNSRDDSCVCVCAETCYPISNICYMVNIRFFKLSGRVYSGFFKIGQ